MKDPSSLDLNSLLMTAGQSVHLLAWADPDEEVTPDVVAVRRFELV